VISGAAIRERGRRDDDEVVIELITDVTVQAADPRRTSPDPDLRTSHALCEERAAGRSSSTARPAGPYAAVMSTTAGRKQTSARRRHMEEHRFERTHYRP
jgi:hypothetical protein